MFPTNHCRKHMQILLKDWCTLALKYMNLRIKNSKKKFPPEINWWLGHNGLSCARCPQHAHTGCMLYYLRKNDYNNALKSALLTDNTTCIAYVYNVLKERSNVDKLHKPIFNIIIKYDLVNSFVFFFYSETNTDVHLQNPNFMLNIYKYDAVKINRFLMDINRVRVYSPIKAISNNSVKIFNEMMNRGQVPAGYGQYLFAIRSPTNCTLYVDFFLRLPVITESIHIDMVSAIFRIGGNKTGTNILKKLLSDNTKTRHYSSFQFWHFMEFAESADFLVMLTTEYASKLSMYRLMLNIVYNTTFNNAETFSLFKIVADSTYDTVFTPKLLTNIVRAPHSRNVRDILTLIHTRIGYLYFDHPEIIEAAYQTNFNTFAYLITNGFPCTKQQIRKLKSRLSRPTFKTERDFIDKHLS